MFTITCGILSRAEVDALMTQGVVKPSEMLLALETQPVNHL